MSRSFMTNVSPLPSDITRDAAVTQLHDHTSMIRVNPLVIKFELTTAPAEASRDEVEFGTWYEITDKINYLPGINGQVSYKACFYDLPNGLQTHTFAPAGLDLRSKYLVCGSMPGEPREPLELGLDAPREGLYIKEEVDMRCNILFAGFVKKNLKKSHAAVINGLISRAESALPQGLDSDHSYQESRPVSVGRTTNFSRIELRPPSAAIEGSPLRTLHRSLNDQRPPPTTFIPSMSITIPGRSSLPLHCNCTGAFHLRSCSYFHPDDRGDLDVVAAPGVIPRLQPPRRHTVSAPSVASISPISSRSSSPERIDPRIPELYGSVRSDQCLCTGAIHTRGCPGYPGLRTPGAATAAAASSSSYRYTTTTTSTSSPSPHYTTTTTTTASSVSAAAAVAVAAPPPAATAHQRMPVSPLPAYAQMLSAASPTAATVAHHLGENTEFSALSSSPEEHLLRPSHNFSYSSPAFDGFTHT